MDLSQLGDSQDQADGICGETSPVDNKKRRKSSYDRLRYLENRETHIKQVVEYKKKNREKVNKAAKIRNDKNREHINRKARENYAKNKAHYRKRVNAYLKANKSKNRKWQRKHRKTSILAIISGRCRSRVHIALRQQSTVKHERTWKLIGCTSRFFRDYLASQFTPEMSWDNYGKYWVIDHISPVSKFDLKKPWQQHIAFHYTNCRPLEKNENKLKSDKVLQLHELLEV